MRQNFYRQGRGLLPFGFELFLQFAVHLQNCMQETESGTEQNNI